MWKHLVLATSIITSLMATSHTAYARVTTSALQTEKPVEIYLSEVPGPQNIMEWNRTSRRLIGSSAAPRKDIKFSIPAKYVVRDQAGKIDIQKTFRNWNSSQNLSLAALNRLGPYETPIQHRGVNYYPFKEGQRVFYVNAEPLISQPRSGAVAFTIGQNGRAEVLHNGSPSPSYLLSVTSPEHIRALSAQNSKASTALDEGASPSRLPVIGSHSEEQGFIPSHGPDRKVKFGISRKLTPEELAIRNEELAKNRIHNGYTETSAPRPAVHSPGMSTAVDARSIDQDLVRISQSSSLRCNRTTNAAQCMVCNCLSEARGEPDAGQIAVGRVTLTRNARSGFPNGICSVVWQPHAFSWTKDSVQTFRAADGIQTCANNMRKALQLGIWQWDHFYAPNKINSPSWARRMAHRGTQQIGNHLFLNSGNSLAHNMSLARTQDTTPSQSIE